MRRWLIVWLALSSAVALFLPDCVKLASDLLPGVAIVYAPSRDPLLAWQTFLPYLFAVTMFGVGWLLPADELDEMKRSWGKIVLGTTVQYVSMPLLAYGVGRLLRLPEPLLIGTVMVGCVPGAMASNVLTLTAGGHVGYSLSLTTLATLVSPLVVPLLMQLLLQQTRDFPTSRVVWQLVWMVVLPTLAGHSLSRASGTWSTRLRGMWSVLANLTILWIVATVVAQNRERLAHVPSRLLVALLLINLGGYGAGWLAGRAWRLPSSMVRAITLEVGMQNAGLGTVLVQSVFSDLPEAQIPTAMYTFGCMLTGTILAGCWARSAGGAKTARP